MRATISDGCSATLHEDREGNEWIILTSADYPDAEEELTPDDAILFSIIRDLIERAQE